MTDGTSEDDQHKKKAEGAVASTANENGKDVE